MDITKLKYFTVAAECGSFSETARILYTSQPNISRQISSLEKELGARLFYRSSQDVRLTHAGEYLYDQIRNLPSELERIFETVRAFGREDAGELRIGLLAGQRPDRELTERFRRFTQTYPGLNFTLERAGFSDLQRSLNSFKFDLIITLSFDIDPSPEFVIEPLKTNQQPGLFVSRMNPLAQEPLDLSRMPFVVISPEESFGGYSQLLRTCHNMGFEPNIVRFADSLDSLLFYVETGVGVAMLDRHTRLETDQDILIIPIEDQDSPDVVAVWLQKNTNPNIRKIVGCLKGG